MSRVLLLNATFEPLMVIPVRRALTLLVSSKVEVVEETGEHIHSPRATFSVPSVVRLITYVKVPYRAELPLTKRHLMARDRGRCQYCGKAGDTIDHVQPRSKGGRHEWANVVIACRHCNGRKANMTLDQLGWKLSLPKVPRGTGWLVVGVVRFEPAWEPYLGPVAA